MGKKLTAAIDMYDRVKKWLQYGLVFDEKNAPGGF